MSRVCSIDFFQRSGYVSLQVRRKFRKCNLLLELLYAVSWCGHMGIDFICKRINKLVNQCILVAKHPILNFLKTLLRNGFHTLEFFVHDISDWNVSSNSNTYIYFEFYPYLNSKILLNEIKLAYNKHVSSEIVNLDHCCIELLVHQNSILSNW